MFEEQAEEKYCKGCKLRMEQCLWAWRNTNGLNEPNEKNCSCKEVPAYIKGANFGYNKANEWHYVKDGDFPKDKKLCLIWCGEKDFNTAEYVRKRFWELCGGWLEVDEVIAWKEIVLPKED